MIDLYIQLLDKHIAQRLKQLRKGHKISLEKLAEVIDVSQQQMSRYEAGRNHMAGSYLYLLAEAFNVPVSYFYTCLNKQDTTISVRDCLQGDWPIDLATDWRAEDRSEREALLTYYWQQLPSEQHREQTLRLLEVMAMGK